MLRAGSLCMTLLYKYMTTNSESKDNLNEKSRKLKLLADTFSQYGGLLSKVSQILVLNDVNNNVFSDCKPFSRDKTHNYIIKQYENNPEYFQLIKELNFEIYKSGSVGQVYRATLLDDREIILKIQYVGLVEQTRQDLKLLDMMVSYLYSDFSEIDNAITDIKQKINEELDYQIEKRNQQYAYEAFFNEPQIHIPQIIEELCTDKILTMEYMDGYTVLNEFINNSTQEQRNEIGKLIIKFIFKSLFNHRILYPDCHYGNFLVKNDATAISILDFGCLVYMEPELVNSLRDIHYLLKANDKNGFLCYIEKMGIINSNTSEDSREYAYDYFKLQYEPLLIDNEDFQFYPEWLDLVGDKNTELMKEWNCPPNMIYLHKIPYGLYHLLTKLDLRCNVGAIIEEILG